MDGPLGDKINALLSFLADRTIHIPGLGLVCTTFIVLAVGWLTRHVVVREALKDVDALIDRVPLVRSLYNAGRQIVSPFADNAKLPFSQVVLVEYPMVGRHTLGLVARERVTDDAADDRMVVFFPSNHLHLGYPVVLSRHDVQAVDMTVEEAIKFFVSCGVVGDDRMVRWQGQLVGDSTPAGTG